MLDLNYSYLTPPRKSWSKFHVLVEVTYSVGVKFESIQREVYNISSFDHEKVRTKWVKSGEICHHHYNDGSNGIVSHSFTGKLNIGNASMHTISHSDIQLEYHKSCDHPPYLTNSLHTWHQFRTQQKMEYNANFIINVHLTTKQAI